MTTKDTLRKITNAKVLLLDGATGTQLAKSGMPTGVSPEVWALEHSSVLIKIQQAYIDAGSDAVFTCTFGGNRLKLAEFGLEKRTAEINTTLALISRDAVQDRAFVFGDIAPTGLFVEPFGDLGFDEAVDVYAEQVRALHAGGVDGFVIETMIDLQETRAALIAVKETCSLPVMVCMTFGTDGRTLNGTDPLSALITFQSLGADAVGCNCSTGPQAMAKVIAIMKPYATIPLMAKPNAGMPRLINGVTTFTMTPEEFGDHGSSLVESGASIIGGCCGTTPEYISALKNKVVSLSVSVPRSKEPTAICSYKETVRIGRKRPITLFGGKINPSGQHELRESLLHGDMSLVRNMAQEQARKGAVVIDVNIHTKRIDEPKTMRTAVLTAAKASGKPVAIDTVNVEAAERALRVFPGRAVLNSVSAKPGEMEKMCAIAQRYGAMIVCMPVDEYGVPKTVTDAVQCIEKILACAETYGISNEACLVDCLVLTAAAGPTAHRRTLQLIDWCTKQNLVSIGGISNCTYGLEERQWFDTTLLCMAAGRGLTAAFIDMESEYTHNSVYALDALSEKDAHFSRYISRFGQQTIYSRVAVGKGTSRTFPEQVFDAVIAGDEERIEGLIVKALDNGETPRSLVDDRLIPAINAVGDKFDRKEYFLPQLITCADTMRKGFNVLQPYLNSSGDTDTAKLKETRVLLATVQGDIHDIGKNIVALMLNNYNFDVIDLGKDVTAEDIIRAAQQHNADIIGLSALMTTTMVEMKNVIDLARSSGLENVRFMIGGAVVDQHYADEIGAHGYARDAIGAVRLAQRFGNNDTKH